MQAEILKMIENLDEFEKQKEVLWLKSKMYDIIGQRLFILHHILDAIVERNFNINNVKKMLTTMLSEIDNGETPKIDALQNSIITAFELIGFNILITGDMPKDVEKAKALIKIIRECATNAIRHANATKLFVKIANEKIEISNNGKFNAKTFDEGTGIQGMRLNAAELGGELALSTQNSFKVTINIKKWEKQIRFI